MNGPNLVVRTCCALCVAGFVMLLVGTGAEALYIWKDESGVTHITEYPDPRTSDEATEKLRYRGPDQSPPPTEDAGTGESELVPRAIVPRPALRFSQPEAVDPEIPTGRPFAPAPPTRETPPGTAPDVQPQMEDAVLAVPASPLTPEEQQQLKEAFEQVPGLPPGFELEDRQTAGLIAMIMALFAGFFFMFMVVGLLAWVFWSLCLYLIAKKLDVVNPWLAWIPLAQIYTLVACAGKPWWWLLFLFVPVVNIVATVIIFLAITENLGLNKWLGLLIIVPLVQFGFMGYLAFSRNAMPAGAGAEPGGYEDFGAEPLPGDVPYDEQPYGDFPDLPPDDPSDHSYGESEPPPLPK